MEALLIALFALGKVCRSRAASVPEPNNFQRFDQQALREVYRTKDESPSITGPYPAQQLASKLGAVYPPPVPFNSQIFWRSVRSVKKRPIGNHCTEDTKTDGGSLGLVGKTELGE